MSKIYEECIGELEKIVEALDSEFPRPALIKYCDQLAYRHDPRVRSDVLASYLKIVRIVSLLNASLCLMEKGYAQEVNLLCRAVDEAEEDISFFALNIGETGTSDKQIRLLKEFYQEQLEDPNDPLSTVSRDRVPRKYILAAISNTPISNGDPHTRRTVAKSIFETFSGFVHGPYVFIMELYGGRATKYHMRGTPNLPYMTDCIDNFANHVFRSILAVETISYRIGRRDVAARSIELSCKLTETTKCLDEEGIAGLKKRLVLALDPELASVK